ncbi:MAG: RDD family protein [Bacteroidota bacterium]
MDHKKYQTALKRIGAAVVDGIVFMPLIFIEQWIFSSVNNLAAVISWLAFSAFIPIAYSVILHHKYGQTIGKWVTGIKVVDISELKNINLKQSIIRDAVCLTFEVIGLLFFIFLIIQTGKGDYIINDYKNYIGVPFLWWTIIELLTMFTNFKRRAIHDFMAKSVVIIHK